MKRKEIISILNECIIEGLFGETIYLENHADKNRRLNALMDAQADVYTLMGVRKLYKEYCDEDAPDCAYVEGIRRGLEMVMELRKDVAESLDKNLTEKNRHYSKRKGEKK
mgnify:CR=1 FL=1